MFFRSYGEILAGVGTRVGDDAADAQIAQLQLGQPIVTGPRKV